MAALTAPYEARRKDGDFVAYPVAANTEVFKGGLAVLSAAGYAQPGADVASTLFIGVFAESVDNITGAIQPGAVQPSFGSPNPPPVGAAGALNVRVYKEGAFVYNRAGATVADLGLTALLVDDNTVQTAATTHNIAVGKIVEIIDASHVRVRIDLEVN
jgi:hypothetical protein